MNENTGRRKTQRPDPSLILIRGIHMTIQEFEARFAGLGSGYKTKELDRFNMRLIKEKADVSALRTLIRAHPEYFRTYFQVSMAYCLTLEEKLAFVEDNFDLLEDWWHTDCLIPWLGAEPDFDFVLQKAREYVCSPLPYVRRWGYVMFIPRLVRDPGRIEPLFSLFKNDDVYHVVMAQAWLLSYLAMCDPEQTLQYLRTCSLDYSIAGRAIQKICDSYQISKETKTRFRSLRFLWKKAD